MKQIKINKDFESLSKKQIEQLSIKQADELIDSGEAERYYAFLAKFMHSAKVIQDRLKESVLKQIELGNDFAFNVKMTTGRKSDYDYSNCNDPVMNSLLVEQEKIKGQIAERAKFLKAIKGHLDILDDETGEVTRVFPPSIRTTEYPKCTY